MDPIIAQREKAMSSELEKHQKRADDARFERVKIQELCKRQSSK
jgi:hypothetical protein